MKHKPLDKSAINFITSIIPSPCDHAAEQIDAILAHLIRPTARLHGGAVAGRRPAVPAKVTPRGLI